ncbi:hypothetical protein [Mycolicibacterium sp. 120270]|uniref:hypothetical protein n=1 Tax=Mycolicibacterium sp. 120270 TaxID=3090600 RepID=UPI00299E5BDF|nr:hypothetical protein [Mycolicibacterium sp. 120270]MDX1883298.1 hypothetical protein [Mycolicibacterium sp. 120270]
MAKLFVGRPLHFNGDLRRCVAAYCRSLLASYCEFTPEQKGVYLRTKCEIQDRFFTVENRSTKYAKSRHNNGVGLTLALTVLPTGGAP